jgi:hypothetical protein
MVAEPLNQATLTRYGFISNIPCPTAENALNFISKWFGEIIQTRRKKSLIAASFHDLISFNQKHLSAPFASLTHSIMSRNTSVSSRSFSLSPMLRLFSPSEPSCQARLYFNWLEINCCFCCCCIGLIESNRRYNSHPMGIIFPFPLNCSVTHTANTTAPLCKANTTVIWFLLLHIEGWDGTRVDIDFRQTAQVPNLSSRASYRRVARKWLWLSRGKMSSINRGGNIASSPGGFTFRFNVSRQRDN